MAAFRDDALAVLRRLRKAGYTAYFAGGCVRDLLLKLEPKDYDVATDAPPGKVRELFSNTQAVGAAFGVILVRQRSSVIEVATFRSDGEYSDGRRPESVRFSTPEEDARRRDFTINGLFLDPISGDVIDYVGGQEDLKNRVMRAIGDPNHRFEEDHLRMLRAVRFAARFGLTIDDQTAAAIRAHAAQIKRISPERIADELRKMLMARTRANAWRLLKELDLVREVFRLLTVRESGLKLIAALPDTEITVGLALAAAVLQMQITGADAREFVSKSAITQYARALRQLLKLSNEELDDFAGTLAGLGVLIADDPPTLARKKRFLATPTAENSMILLRALAELTVHRDCAQTLLPELAALRSTVFAPAPFITGDDLTTAGLQPGPLFKRILDETYDAQLEGRIMTKEEAMKFALSLK
jgi:poly(A) polymerase